MESEYKFMSDYILTVDYRWFMSDYILTVDYRWL
jgi:hypothetical protein